MAVYAFSKGLKTAGVDIKLFAMNTSRHFVDIEKLPADFINNTQLEAVEVDNRLKVWDAFKNLFSHESYHISRFISKQYELKLIDILKSNQYDVIQLEGLYVSPYIETIRKYSKAKIVYRAHNIEFEIWEKLTAQASFIKKWYLKLLTKRLKQFEINQLNKFDAILSITKVDKESIIKLGFKGKIYNAPFGVTIAAYNPSPTQEIHSIFHIASMDWLPNVEGLEWFLENAWPSIYKKFPQLQLYLAGKYFPEHLQNIQLKGVKVVGEVADAKYFMNEKNMMIVPLLSGSGIRIKIIEGLALGKTIIATTIAAQGIEYINGENILIADTAEAFEQQIEKCLKDENYCKKIGNNARTLAVDKYDNEKIIQQLVNFYKEL